jgi:hypothetical protein
MRVIELSNHPGDMLNDVARRRRAADSKARSQHEHALVQHQAQVQAARVKRDRARTQHQWWAWLRLTFGVWALKRRAPRPPGPSTEPTDAEEKIRAGIAGEQLVATELGRALSDDWTLLRGYRNRRGEIDHVLLGPKGLFAIEVKNVNATVQVDGDTWQADKYDNYGNLVEQYLITDRKGRSPSEQLNESADELERFLRDRGQQTNAQHVNAQHVNARPVKAQRVVVLTHRRSRLAAASHPTVNVATSTGSLLTLVNGSPDRLEERQRAELQRLIQRDHDFHERTRRRPGPQNPRKARTP